MDSLALLFNPFTILSLIIFALYIVAVVVAYRTLQAIRSNETPEIVNRFPEGLPEPLPAMREMHNTFIRLGYQLIAAVESKTTKGINRSMYYVNPSALHMAVELALPPNRDAIMGVITLFQNDASILTLFPSGDHVETDQFVCNYGKFSLEATLDNHRQRVEQWWARYGEPRVLDTLDLILAADDLWRRRDRPVMMAAGIRVAREGLAVNAIGLAICTLIVVVILTGIVRPEFGVASLILYFIGRTLESRRMTRFGNRAKPIDMHAAPVRDTSQHPLNAS